jgi:hypothetical protein
MPAWRIAAATVVPALTVIASPSIVTIRLSGNGHLTSDAGWRVWLPWNLRSPSQKFVNQQPGRSNGCGDPQSFVPSRQISSFVTRRSIEAAYREWLLKPIHTRMD